MRTLNFTAFVFLFAVAGHLAAAAPQSHPHVTVDVLADVAAIGPGTPFQLGIYLKMEPGWYTYWRNPGDSGLAPVIGWVLPNGFSTSEIQWPAPIAETDGDFTNFAFKPDVLLPVTVTPPDDFVTDTAFTFSAKVEWLLCKTVCVGGSSDLSITLPGAAAAQSADTRTTALFDAFRKQIPENSAEWTVTGTYSKDKLRLTFRLPPASAGISHETLRLFPITPMIISNSNRQIVTPVSDRVFEITIRIDPMAVDIPDVFEGVLTWMIPRETGSERRALQFSAALTHAGTSQGGPTEGPGMSRKGVAGKQSVIPSPVLVSGSAIRFVPISSVRVESGIFTSTGSGMADPFSAPKRQMPGRHTPFRVSSPGRTNA